MADQTQKTANLSKAVSFQVQTHGQITFIQAFVVGFFHGFIQPEMKAALGKLQQLYKTGQIDQEFGVKDSKKADQTSSASEHVAVHAQNVAADVITTVISSASNKITIYLYISI
ncbi:hypothetical protein [Paenibacillus sp. FSL H7-0331]|uniref:hypothetical protein n=1 Tax=Paenibacillus sp. FSL H7-0331 TaxID=1920421 RepID=UPI00117F5965|nr:hypothetical protein [Paenibacillus sp. FSL H7-0331]